MTGQKNIGASPLGSAATTLKMLEFPPRHQIAPQTEVMPMSTVNGAFKKWHDENPARRIILQNDIA